jgi:chromate reductase, NAD(P)H dehydrogenase (quinone)
MPQLIPDPEYMRIIAISGSLRKQSYNLSLLRTVAEVAPPGAEIVIYPLNDLPIFNADVEESGVPPAVRAFHEAIAGCDGVIIATPEYDHAFSGALKNALDWCSHHEVLAGKPITTMSASPSPGGGSRAQLALREVLFALTCDVMTHLELFVRSAKGKFDEHGTMTDVPTREAVVSFVADFVAFVDARASSVRVLNARPKH